MTETNEKVEPKPIDLGEYKYGFRDDVTPVFSTGKGISEDVVRAMSAEKGEPEWMLEFRLKSLETNYNWDRFIGVSGFSWLVSFLLSV